MFLQIPKIINAHFLFSPLSFPSSLAALQSKTALASMASSVEGLSSLRCHFVAPEVDTPSPWVSRWSDSKIERPALVVTPETEQDVQTSIDIAKKNDLVIVTGGGGHGTFVAVGPRTLYLDMTKFKAIQLDKDRGLVHVGGGVLTGELLKALAAEGYYAPLPNSNAVGVVGCSIGGGSTPLNGLHGWMVDLVSSFRLVTSEGEVVEVGSSSTGKDLELFHALCGAGHGLGVITSMTTSAFPISDLNMTEDKVWKRSLVFLPSSIDAAARTFMDLPQPSPAAGISITFLCPPPGSPIVIVESTYFGPSEKAEAEFAVMLDENLVQQALVAKTEPVAMASLNDRFEPQNAHGGHKAIASCRTTKTDAETIKAVFNKWLSAIQKYPDAQRSPLVISSYNSAKHIQLGKTAECGPRFLESRDRDITAMIVAICEKEETMTAMTDLLDDIMVEFRKGDPEATPRSFPNNLRFGMNLEEMFSRERLEKLGEIKKTWDANGIFWSPYQNTQV